MLNDAQVHGAAVITGVGYEVIFTLGTGLGCAIFDEGQVVPKIELSRAPVRKHQIYDTWVGAAARRRIGRAKWERRVLRAIAACARCSSGTGCTSAAARPARSPVSFPTM